METAVHEAIGEILARLNLDQASLDRLCRANGVRRLAVFGSAVRDDFDPQRSDLDVLVTLDAPSATRYAEHYFGLKEDLEHIVGRPVDLVTERSITNPLLAKSIAAEKVTLFAT